LSQLAVDGHTGIVAYDPRELVVTARAGTRLAELEAELAACGQMLAFEPPHFSEQATLGGAVASGLSGPRRAYCGAVRDFVLGCRVLDGNGKQLNFGGQVIKNVAGYDVSRLMVGAWGTLGVLLEVSLKVLPQPRASVTVVQSCTADEALQRVRDLARQPLPLDASCHCDGRLYLRLSGEAAATEAARRRLGGDVLSDADEFWRSLRDHALPFFAGTPLWRLSLPATAAMPPLAGDWLLEWGGALRWLKSDAPVEQVRAAAEQAGGHAMLFRGGARHDVFHPLPAPLLALHQRLKQSFDPQGLFNPGLMAEAL
jgi:glycolate oxidase FAD binding subunit